jgi:hypothetical protein
LLIGSFPGVLRATTPMDNLDVRRRREVSLKPPLFSLPQPYPETKATVPQDL